MECREIRDALVRGETPLGQELEAHLAACPGCAELLTDDNRLGQALAHAELPELDASALLGEVLGSIDKERGFRAWLRSRSTPVRALVPFAAMALVAVFVALFKRRPDIPSFPAGLFAGVIALYVLLIGAAVALELRPLQRSAPAPWLRPLLVVGALAIPVLIAVLPLAHHAPLAYAPPGKSFAALAFGCFTFGLVLAVPALLFLWASDRVAHRSFRLALLAAGFGGLVGNLVLQLHCPVTDPAHRLLGHASIGLVLAIVYATWLLIRSQPLGSHPERAGTDRS